MFRRKKMNDTKMSLHQMWDRERARAMTPAERDEIDAIFARYA